MVDAIDPATLKRSTREGGGESGPTHTNTVKRPTFRAEMGLGTARSRCHARACTFFHNVKHRSIVYGGKTRLICALPLE